MSMEGKAVFGIFRQQPAVEKARQTLEARGFLPTEITVRQATPSQVGDISEMEQSLIKPFSLVGAVLGGILFATVATLGVLGLLPFSPVQDASLAFSPLWTVGLGLVGGILLGAAIGTLVGIGTPQPACDRYGNYMDVGGILLSVRTESEEKNQAADEILRKAGAQDVATLDEKDGWLCVRSKVTKNLTQISA